MLDKTLFKDDSYYIKDSNKYIFKEYQMDDLEDDLDILKNRLKKFTKLYYFLIDVISPVFIDGGVRTFLNNYVTGKKKMVLNIGSGNSKLSDEIINIDIFRYEHVNIVCDISDLPFKDNSIDIILNIAVLEHVPDPQKVINEIHRVLKPEGIIYTAFPFMQGFHASPYDFTRVTEEGIKYLHSNFEPIEVKPFGGPTSGMLWIFQEWVAILFSFGSKKLHLLIYLLVMLLTFPLKYIDYFLIRHPAAKNIASGFIFIGSKK